MPIDDGFFVCKACQDPAACLSQVYCDLEREKNGQDRPEDVSAAPAAPIPLPKHSLETSLSLFACLWAMIEAERELVKEPRIDDDTPVLQFMGSGASCQVYAKDVRNIANLDASAPIPMLLYCPRCEKQHIDAPEPEKQWSNPPHATHTCKGCGLLWRPSNRNTTGIEKLEASEEKHEERIKATEPRHARWLPLPKEKLV